MYEVYAKLRDEKGLSDYQVAIDTGVPKSTLSDWKLNKSNPKADKLLKLAKYFDVPVETFIKEEQNGKA